MVKTSKLSFTEDEVREAILRFLYEKYHNPKGMDSAKVKITEIRRVLKNKGIDHKQVIRNLQYLIGAKFVEEVVKESQFDTGRFKVPTEKKSYKITNLGIEYFEVGSKFSKSEALTGIKIDNSGIVIMGNNNYARQEFVPIFKSLDDLKNKIGITNEIDEDTKIDYQAEVRTIQSQLIKQNPDKDTVMSSWERLKQVGSVASLVTPVANISLLITKFFGLTP